jgi:hypothetical protein
MNKLNLIEKYQNNKIKIIGWSSEGKFDTIILENDLFFRLDYKKYKNISGYKKGEFKRNPEILDLIKFDLIAESKELTSLKIMIEKYNIVFSDEKTEKEIAKEQEKLKKKEEQKQKDNIKALEIKLWKLSEKLNDDFYIIDNEVFKSKNKKLCTVDEIRNLSLEELKIFFERLKYESKKI